MSSPLYFHCKQFSVLQDSAAMKVHTDGCLLGAWTAARIPEVNGRVLDVGTGTGIIALMLAQRFGNPVDAIDLDGESAAVAAHNFAASPWANRMKAIHSPIEGFRPKAGYGLLVCNPPYFQNSLHSPLVKKNLARHQSAMGPAHLFEAADQLLLPEKAYFTLIIPAKQAGEMEELAKTHHLSLYHKVWVNSGGKKPKARLILAFSREGIDPRHIGQEAITLKGEVMGYSAAFSELLKPYYTIF
jgi:tRNA1Val (adenine37-N6)-methyltransferase